MGAGESTRKLIVEDSVIEVSESVVRRLKGQPEVQSIPNVQQSPPPQQQHQHQQSPPPKQQQQHQQDDTGKSKPQVKSESKSSKAKEVYIDRPVYYPVPSQDTKKAIQEVEAFYQDKLKQLEAKNAQLQKITTEQFAKAVQEVEQKFLKQTGTPVCGDMQGKVYNCYSSNPNQTLNCYKEVGAFTSCVERARLNAIARRS